MLESEPKNEEETQSERITGIMRVVGVDPQKEKQVLENIKDKHFDRQDIPLFQRVEREKTQEELKIIEKILSVMPKFIKEYGGKPVDVRLENIHIIDPDKLTEQERKIIGSSRGKYHSDIQAMSVICSPDDNLLNFAHIISHELIHFNAFQSVNVDENGDIISSRVEGVMVGSSGNSNEKHFYFNGLNEAITEKLAMKFNNEYFPAFPELSDAIKERDRFASSLKNHKKIKSFTNRKVGDIWYATAEGYSYAPERREFKKLIREIQHKNPDKFESDADVFKIFAKAYFTGERLNIARLIEKTLGRGSFRSIGEKSEKLSEPNKD